MEYRRHRIIKQSEVYYGTRDQIHFDKAAENFKSLLIENIKLSFGNETKRTRIELEHYVLLHFNGTGKNIKTAQRIIKESRLRGFITLTPNRKHYTLNPQI